MTTLSVMVISITIQNLVRDSAGILQMNNNRTVSLSRQHTWQCRGSTSCHGMKAARGPDTGESGTPSLLFRRGCQLSWLTVVLHLPEYSCSRFQRCGLTPPARDLYSLCASLKLPHESEISPASVPTHAGSQRGSPREQAVPFSGRATTCHISKDRAEENKTIILKSSKD